MVNTSHIESALSNIRSIFEKASERIEALKPGEKVAATELAKELGKEIGMTGPQLYPVLLFLFKGYPGVLVKRGAHGGIIRPKLVEPEVKPTTQE
jgi:hypothetical protein